MTFTPDHNQTFNKEFSWGAELDNCSKADDSGGVNGGDSSGVASVADKTFEKFYDGTSYYHLMHLSIFCGLVDLLSNLVWS